MPQRGSRDQRPRRYHWVTVPNCTHHQHQLLNLQHCNIARFPGSTHLAGKLKIELINLEQLRNRLQNIPHFGVIKYVKLLNSHCGANMIRKVFLSNIHVNSSIKGQTDRKMLCDTLWQWPSCDTFIIYLTLNDLYNPLINWRRFLHEQLWSEILRSLSPLEIISSIFLRKYPWPYSKNSDAPQNSYIRDIPSCVFLNMYIHQLI